MFKVVPTVVHLALLALVFGLSVEATARIDDWINSSIPVLAPVSSHEDLTFHDGVITRGRPSAVHKKWRLNQFGFRGPEISLKPASGITRVMILGSSETFGLYESPNHEFPAIADRLLKATGNYEVINTAITGMTTRTMSHYWSSWVKQFQPAIVIIYPAPLFYLNMVNRHEPKASSGDSKTAATGKSNQTSQLLAWLRNIRVLERAKDVFELPEILQRRVNAKALKEAQESNNPGWELTSLAPAYVDEFIEDLATLVESIKNTSICILVTHATRSTSPPRSEDIPFLEAARVHVPRATTQVIVGLEVAAASAMRQYASKSGVTLIDAATLLSGKSEYFADVVHFTDAGAHAIAALIATKIAELALTPGSEQGSQLTR